VIYEIESGQYTAPKITTVQQFCWTIDRLPNEYTYRIRDPQRPVRCYRTHVRIQGYQPI